ncbi:MAG: hypothetical protein JO057_22710 [Chloroflexi bacterium]|nr:hypothetical protein [Chloroflexota bacterium]
MGLLDSVLSNPQQQQDLQGYVQRYQQGAPQEGYSDQEVLQRYQQVAPQLNQQEYQAAAQQAFDRMSPQDRQQFGQYVEQQLGAQGTPNPGFGQNGGPQTYQDASYLAQQTAQLHQQQPGLLGQLLGGGGSSGSGNSGGGGILANPAAKAALAGIAAMAVSNAIGGNKSGNPLGGLLGR